jgi:hypothetical protein
MAATFVVTRVAIARTSVVIGSIVGLPRAADPWGPVGFADPDCDVASGRPLATRMVTGDGRSSCSRYVIRPRPPAGAQTSGGA